MKRLINNIYLTATAVIVWIATIALSGCTHNNGNIGPWFGSWTLESVSVNGVNDDNYRHNVSWSFQSGVIRMQVDNGLGNYSDHFGSWKDEGDTLQLNYTHHETGLPSWMTKYDFPTGIYLPKNAIIDMEIKSMTKSKVTLLYTTNEGDLITYSLSKLY